MKPIQMIIEWVIQNWTNILSNLVAAAVFLLILKLLPFIGKFLTSKLLSFSKTNRLERLQPELLKYQACESEDDAHSAFLFTTIIIGALNNFIKAAISICLGLILNEFVPIFFLIGLIFALYYLIMAAFAVKDTDPKIDAKKRMEEIVSEIKIIEDKLKK